MIPDDIWRQIIKYNDLEYQFASYRATKQELMNDLIQALEREREYSSHQDLQIRTLARINRSLRRRINIANRRGDLLEERLRSLEAQHPEIRSFPLSVYRTLDYPSSSDSSSIEETEIDELEEVEDIEI